MCSKKEEEENICPWSRRRTEKDGEGKYLVLRGEEQRGKIFGPRRRRRTEEKKYLEKENIRPTEKEKEETIWRRKMNGDANQPTN